MNRQRRAFTLLELILSMGIAAMMASAIYSAMSAAFKARTSAQAQMRDIRSASIALELLEQDLQSILPPTGTLAGPMVGYAMGSEGREADSLEFYCIGRDRSDSSSFSEGFRRVRWVLRTDTTPVQLVREVTRNLLSPSAQEATQEVIATDVIGFSVRFYDGKTWLDEWDSALQYDALPVAMELIVRKRSERDATNQTYSLTRLVRLPAAVTQVDAAATEAGGQ